LFPITALLFPQVASLVHATKIDFMSTNVCECSITASAWFVLYFVICEITSVCFLI